MRFELTTSTLAIFLQPTTPFGKFSNINHLVSRGVACRPEVSCGKWKVGWKVWAGSKHCGDLRSASFEVNSST